MGTGAKENGDGGSASNEAVYQKLMNYALFILGVRRYTNYEMREKLKKWCKKKFGGGAGNGGAAGDELECEPTISRVIGRLEELKYLNDEEYLADFVRNRMQLRPRGIGALRYELRKKGIERDLIEKYFSENEIDEMKVALDLAQRKLAHMKRIPEQKKFSKIAMLLNSRGFKPHTIYEILNNLKNGNPTND